MEEFTQYLPNLGIAYAAYLIATLSPGPANLAIMATSMRNGRQAGVSLASGVVIGSLTWGVLAAAGLSAFMMSFGWLMSALKIVGGLYLLWLGLKSFRAATRSHDANTIKVVEAKSSSQYFLLGLGIHLTNPKSIFAWLAIITLGVSPNAPLWISFLIVGGCWFLGVFVFGGYALAFSTKRMIKIYTSFRRWIEGTTAAVFTFAGFKLITSNS